MSKLFEWTDKKIVCLLSVIKLVKVILVSSTLNVKKYEFHSIIFSFDSVGPTSPSKPTSERSMSIEQARQRKQLEEEERKKQREAAAREKLRLLDARTRPEHIQTHEISVREQAGEFSKMNKL